MKLVYLAHPYGGENENFHRSCDLTTILTERHPKYHIFNAVRYFVQFKHYLNEGEIMTRCLDTLSRCDQLWLAPGWMESKGCLEEYMEATRLGLPIKYVTKSELRNLSPWEKSNFSLSDIFSDIPRSIVEQGKEITITDGANDMTISQSKDCLKTVTRNEEGDSMTVEAFADCVKISSEKKDAPKESPEISSSLGFSALTVEPEDTKIVSTNDEKLIIEVDSGIEISLKPNHIHIKKA